MSKKKTIKKAAHLKNFWVALSIAVVLIALVAGFILLVGWLEDDNPDSGSQNVGTGDFRPVGTGPNVSIEDLQDFKSEVYMDLRVEKIGSYSGLFVEDGSDDVLSRVLMIIVKNTGTKTVQYAQIELSDNKTTAHFTLSTLPPGESVVLLEKNRMSYADGKNLTQVTVQNVALFDQPLDLCDDRIQVQALNGIVNVINVSGKDITGDVEIYYKNASSDMLYGGITYRITVAGGMKAGEIKQVVAKHITEKGSRVMWVTVG